MQGERPFDFFISYNTLDREHATRVADVLEAAGYRVFLDYRCIPAAFDWAVLLGWGIQAAQRLLPIVSRNFTQSAFASAEWSSFFAQDPAGLNGLILPAFIEDFPLPHFLRTRKGPQLYRYKPANWRKHILAALQ